MCGPRWLPERTARRRPTLPAPGRPSWASPPPRPSTPLLSCGPPSPVDRHLVRGFLLPGPPVAALTPRRAPPGKQQRQGRHHLHFLLRPRLGELGGALLRAGPGSWNTSPHLSSPGGGSGRLPGPLLAPSVTGQTGKKAPPTPSGCSPASGVALGALVQVSGGRSRAPCLPPEASPRPRSPPLPRPTRASLRCALLCPQAFQAYLALRDLRNDAPVPYKRSLDEGGVALTTLSPPSAAGPVNTPPAGPNSLNYASSALSPYLATPKAPRLAMMPDN